MKTQTPPTPWSDLEETRVHILVAGRELLLAAKGALRFCSQYTEVSGTSSPHLVKFFKKAINVADDLSAGLKNIDTIKKAAGAAMRPLFTAMEQEMGESRKTKRVAADSSRTPRTPTASRAPTSKTPQS